MIGQPQGSRMRISKYVSPRVETGTSKGTDRESTTEVKSETGKRTEKARAERMAGAIDGDFVTDDSVSFCSEVSGTKGFVLYGGL
jgi:hypothetical protein